jgi:hypothetical protein
MAPGAKFDGRLEIVIFEDRAAHCFAAELVRKPFGRIRRGHQHK